MKFFKNFETLFGIKNFKIYVTGESYAGRYVPYISAAFLDQKDKMYYDLSGELHSPLSFSARCRVLTSKCRSFGL